MKVRMRVGMRMRTMTGMRLTTARCCTDTLHLRIVMSRMRGTRQRTRMERRTRTRRWTMMRVKMIIGQGHDVAGPWQQMEQQTPTDHTEIVKGSEINQMNLQI
jgi:hypothetical protein